LIHIKMDLAVEGAYINTYFLDYSPTLKNSALRPLVLICPGGGYEYNSDREAEPIAIAFAARGYHSAVLHYPTIETRFPTALCALGEAVFRLRAQAEQYHINPDQIAVCGFSAGGHLAASLGAFWNKPFLSEKVRVENAMMKPNQLILAYPVITSGEFAHRGSFDNLLGDKKGDLDHLEYVSLENQITSETPPTFLWHTFYDQLVPVENSLLFAIALRKNKIPFEMHVYTRGEHGLALANEITENTGVGNSMGRCIEPACEGWLDMACNWLHQMHTV